MPYRHLPTLAETPTLTNTPIQTETPISTSSLDLAITLTDGNITTVPGGVIAYSLSFANHGGRPASGAALSEILPANTAFCSSSSSPGWIQVGSPNEYIYSIGDLDIGETDSVTFAVTVDSSLPTDVEAITNTSFIYNDGGNGPDLDPTNNVATDTTPITNE